MQSSSMNNIFLGTAHPGKFADIVEPIIGSTIELPKRLKKTLPAITFGILAEMIEKYSFALRKYHQPIRLSFYLAPLVGAQCLISAPVWN